MTFARTLLRIVQRVADWFPLTWLGIFVAGGAAAALQWLAYPELDLVWLVIGFAALGLVGAAVLIVLFGALWMKIATRARPRGEVERTKLETLTLETRRATPTGFDGPTLWFLPLVQIDWSWEHPSDAEVAIDKVRWRMREKVTLSHRGHVDEVRRALVVVAAGNCGVDLGRADTFDWPVSLGGRNGEDLPSMLRVGGLLPNGDRRDSTSFGREWVDLGAPGSEFVGLHRTFRIPGFPFPGDTEVVGLTVPPLCQRSCRVT